MIVHPLSLESRPAVSLTEAILDAVSEAEDCDPLSLPPLWDVIDPESLDLLFAPTRGGTSRSGRVRFRYAGYEVTASVDADATGRVSLESLEG